MAFLREKRSRLSPFPAVHSLSLNSLASMLAKVSSEHEGRREMVFFAISFFPATMDLKVFSSSTCPDSDRCACLYLHQ
jgi:hypothetical protein